MDLDNVNLIHKGVCDALAALMVPGGELEGFTPYWEIPLADDLIFPNVCVVRKPLGPVRNLMGGEKLVGLSIIVMLGFRERDLSKTIGGARLETEALLNHYAKVLDTLYEGLTLDASLDIYDASYTVAPDYPTEEGNDRYVLTFTITFQYKESRL